MDQPELSPKELLDAIEQKLGEDFGGQDFYLPPSDCESMMFKRDKRKDVGIYLYRHRVKASKSLDSGNGWKIQCLCGFTTTWGSTHWSNSVGEDKRNAELEFTLHVEEQKEDKMANVKIKYKEESRPIESIEIKHYGVGISIHPHGMGVQFYWGSQDENSILYVSKIDIKEFAEAILKMVSQ